MTAIEFVVLTPILFLLLMLTVQFALYMFAKQAAQAAVLAGARTAREEAATRGCDAQGALNAAAWDTGQVWQRDAGAQVSTRAQSLGGKLLTFTSADITAGATVDPQSTAACQISQVTMTFAASVPSIIPGRRLQVHVSAGGPLEQFVPHPAGP
jgi:Flp pilus assembly protein TadG